MHFQTDGDSKCLRLWVSDCSRSALLPEVEVGSLRGGQDFSKGGRNHFVLLPFPSVIDFK